MESAAVRDISESSVYPGAFPLYFCSVVDVLIGVVECRVCYSQALYKNRILCVLRDPLTWYVLSFTSKLGGLFTYFVD